MRCLQLMCETEKGIDEGKRCGRTETAEYKPVLFRVERELFIFFFISSESEPELTLLCVTLTLVSKAGHGIKPCIKCVLVDFRSCLICVKPFGAESIVKPMLKVHPSLHPLTFQPLAAPNGRAR